MILDLFNDGKPHELKDVRTALLAQGRDTRHLAIAVSKLCAGGKLKHLDRGVYTLA